MSSKPKAKREKKEDVSLMDVDHPTLIPSQPQNNPPKSPDASKKTAKPSNKAADTQKTHVRGSGRITKTYPATGSKAVGLEKEPKNKQRQVQEVPPPQQQQRQQPAEQITGPPTAPAVIRPGRQLAIDKLAAADANQIQLDRHVRRTLEDVAAGWYEAESFGGPKLNIDSVPKFPHVKFEREVRTVYMPVSEGSRGIPFKASVPKGVMENMLYEDHGFVVDDEDKSADDIKKENDEISNFAWDLVPFAFAVDKARRKKKKEDGK